MSLRNLMSWYEIGDRSRVDFDSLREMVREALAWPEPGLTREEQARVAELLQAANLRLFSQDFPAEELDLLAEEILPRLAGGPSVADAVELGLRELAESLDDDAWRTEAIEALEATLAGDAEGFEAGLQALETRFVQAWESYEQSPVAGFEVTVEAVVGHRLLLEGLQGWIDGLDLLRSGGDLEAALARVEHSQRLLIALQRQQENLERQLSR